MYHDGGSNHSQGDHGRGGIPEYGTCQNCGSECSFGSQLCTFCLNYAHHMTDML